MGKYVWMCQVGGRVDGEGAGAGEGKGDVVGGKRQTEGTEIAKESTGKGCGYFEWAEFDDDGVPIWLNKEKAKESPTKYDQKPVANAEQIAEDR